METRTLTCVSVLSYPHALTRGKVYEIAGISNGKYKIVGDHGKVVKIGPGAFIEGIVTIPAVVAWQFDDDIESTSLIEVTIRFSDGSGRWCIVTTPEKLLGHFQNQQMTPPGFNIRHLLIVRSINREDVNERIKSLESQNELNEATLPL